MKVCIFTENYYKGGVDTFLINLINSWPISNDEISLICNSSHQGISNIKEKVSRKLSIEKYSRFFTSALVQGKTNNIFLKYIPIKLFFSIIYKILQYPVIFPWYIFTLTIFFWRSEFERLIVVNGGYPASLLCRCAVIAWALSGKTPYATMNFHSSAIKAPWYSSLFEYIIDLMIVRFSSNVVSVSQACLLTLKNRKAFIKSKNLSFIHNGISDPLESYENIPTSIVNCSNEDYCLMLATYHEYKGHKFLLQAFDIVHQQYPKVNLKIYGHGWPDEKVKVLKEVHRLKLSDFVTLGDFIADTRKLLLDARVLVVPSQAYESFGMVVVEAMAMNLPVVVTDVGGLPEILNGSGAGYVCSKDNFVEFAEAIKKILSDEALALKMGQNGRATFKRRFQAKTMAASYRKLLK
jgi:glycosyltransferase involved in cell wall biosynthesis